jgi:HSP20 family molecular chaperone IbpA
MLRWLIFLMTLNNIVLADESSLNSLNLKYMYEGAKEVEMLNRSMEAGIREHNAKEKEASNYQESSKSLIDNSSVDMFNDLGDRYILEKEVSGENPKVKMELLNDILKIEIVTTKKETIKSKDRVGQSSLSVTTIEEIPIPFDADISKLKREFKGNLIRVEVPKKQK